MRIGILISLLLVGACSFAMAKNYDVYSPDQKIHLNINVDDEITISIKNNNRIVLEPSLIDLVVDGQNLGSNPKVSKTSKRSFDGIITPAVKVKTAQIKEGYNELILTFKNEYSVIFRAYDEGVAYRFQTKQKKGSVIVNNELLNLQIPTSSSGYLMKEKSFYSMSESPYICSAINEYKEDALFSLPALFKTENNDFLLLMESDIYDYPGLWITKKGDGFKSTLPCKPTKTKEGACMNEQYVTERADYLAETKGDRAYPWRIFAIADNESKLITNQLVYLLATPEKEGDYSWIKPGMATLDWWGRRNIHGADFKGGVNTETHKYFVDFNNEFGLTYFVLDDGWSDACDLKQINKNLDLDKLNAYAKQKNVGLVFWVHAFALKKDISGYLDFFKSKGAVGVKVDFFARDDQDAVNLFHEIAKETLKREMVVDFHGVCKPIGLNRTYPNILTSEGLIEFEMNGVTDWANPQHHTLLPFIRMVTGPMDYLPGTFNNAQKSEFYKYGNRPVGLGSRAHSIALAVLFESPLTMLPDSPSDYLKEKECTTFLSEIPVVWDETKVIDAKIGEYVVIARRSGTDWYLAAITNWDQRSLSVKLDFIQDGKYNLECIKDGANTNTRAIDYKKESSVVNATCILDINMSKGGGWIGKLSKAAY